MPMNFNRSWMLHSLFSCPLCALLNVSPSTNPIGDYWSRISPSMSMIVIGHSLLYSDKDGAVWCMMFIDSLDDYSLIFFFPLYFYGFLCICTSAAPQRPAHGTVPSQVATHLRTDRVCRVLWRSWIWTQDYWFAVRCATIEPPLHLLLNTFIAF